MTKFALVLLMAAFAAFVLGKTRFWKTVALMFFVSSILLIAFDIVLCFFDFSAFVEDFIRDNTSSDFCAEILLGMLGL